MFWPEVVLWSGFYENSNWLSVWFRRYFVTVFNHIFGAGRIFCDDEFVMREVFVLKIVS